MPPKSTSMTIESSFAVMMTRLRDGDQDAASQVFGKFLHRLIALASSQFESRLRAKDDPEDVVQSVYLSFLKRMESSPYELADWGGLWSLLATITVRKCHDRRRFWRTNKRNISAEVGNDQDPDGNTWWEAVDSSPTPLQALVLAETLDQLMELHTPLQRTISEMTFQGYTGVEIARHCGCSERTIYRTVKRIREMLIELDAAEDFF